MSVYLFKFCTIGNVYIAAKNLKLAQDKALDLCPDDKLLCAQLIIKSANLV